MTWIFIASTQMQMATFWVLTTTLEVDGARDPVGQSGFWFFFFLNSIKYNGVGLWHSG